MKIFERVNCPGQFSGSCSTSAQPNSQETQSFQSAAQTVAECCHPKCLEGGGGEGPSRVGSSRTETPENNKIHLSFLIHAELATPYCAASLLQFKKYIFIPIVLYFYFVYQCYTKETIQMIESIDDTVSTCCTG